ncbi:hypothetical protein O7627_21580 [Solwaraspora sp. WMMD1047]|uniref:hypothetical protein n=1 Tax=Solwaraspora sp. WMMD1047 TaxID=3016102 RepID=UPI002416A917|nr:hypothetical protein [Solwaraspora sp. WMMD1047]MDG4831876.1 hypothetical protein [Solwaraspora sp. WMMD1047]
METGTLSGGRPDSTDADTAGPAAIPAGVQVDAYRMLLAQHTPGINGRCRCGNLLGEETGLCFYGRQAQAGLLRIAAAERERLDNGGS